jgi:hypothetical protein
MYNTHRVPVTGLTNIFRAIHMTTAVKVVTFVKIVNRKNRKS